MKSKLHTFIFFLFLIILWEVSYRFAIWPHILFPSPGQVTAYLIDTLQDGSLIAIIFVTIKRLILGYTFGFLIGVPLGIINARFLIVEETLGALILGLQALPTICWAPLAILWFGQNELAMFFIVSMGCAWSIAISTDNAIRNVPPLYIRAARTMGSRGLHLWIKVLIPASLPFIVNGMKQGWAFGWRSLMAAEIYITVISGFGLGNLLHYNRELLSMDGVVGVMSIIVLIGLVIDKGVFSPLERFLYVRWGVNKPS